MQFCQRHKYQENVSVTRHRKVSFTLWYKFIWL